MFRKYIYLIAGTFLISASSCKVNQEKAPRDSVSGIYPALAHYNNENECGTGAVVPWAGKLWVITYGPHLPNGSSDMLYEIAPDMTQITHEESIGGTPANRMIHKESNQLFIGPYAIDADGNVRVIPYSIMPGRHTGNARALDDPENKILYGTMEEGFYEVDVHTLAVKELYPDGNKAQNKKNDTDVGPVNDLLVGVHGKGFYSSQGVAVFSNNGESSPDVLTNPAVPSGSLSEWDGKEWKMIRRNQFTEVTGPGGIYGNPNPATDPIWAVGWDYKSLILGVRDAVKGWSFYRLPKASHAYDGAHGWNTEWPRIRNVGTDAEPNYLMTMHGMFWKFPGQFTAMNSKGIRPATAYLKVIGDFTRWNDQLVFGCDDSAKSEFLNKRKAKGNIEGPGQSNSNVWFTSLDKPYELGPATVEGAVWSKETVKANSTSEPFLFAGWEDRCCWLKNGSKNAVTFTFEVDEEGNGTWKELKKVTVDANKDAYVEFSKQDKGEWIRVKNDKEVYTTVSFNYTVEDQRSVEADPMFQGLADITSTNSVGGILYGLGDNRRALGLLANVTTGAQVEETGYYEMDDQLRLIRKDDAETADFIRTKMAIPKDVISIEDGSILIIDNNDRRWRLPLGEAGYESLTNNGLLRICREVATERDLFCSMGSFYELPAENADGFAKIRPISTSHFRINDYASYRGMLLMTGINLKDAKKNEHIVVSDDGKAAVWAGTIDDLWSLGKPVGHGGPWKDTAVKANVPSDPYLIGFYDKKTLTITPKEDDVNVTIEVDPTGNGDWTVYMEKAIDEDDTFVYGFPASFQARWIRFTVDTDAVMTTWLDYK